MLVNTMAATRSIGRRPKSAKARNRDRSCAGGTVHAMGIWARRDAWVAWIGTLAAIVL